MQACPPRPAANPALPEPQSSPAECTRQSARRHPIHRPPGPPDRLRSSPLALHPDRPSQSASASESAPSVPPFAESPTEFAPQAYLADFAPPPVTAQSAPAQEPAPSAAPRQPRSAQHFWRPPQQVEIQPAAPARESYGSAPTGKLPAEPPPA